MSAKDHRSGMRVTGSSFQNIIVTMVDLGDGKKQYIRRARNQQDKKEFVALPGIMYPMTPKAWRGFVKQRRETLFGKEESANNS